MKVNGKNVGITPRMNHSYATLYHISLIKYCLEQLITTKPVAAKKYAKASQLF